MGNQQQQASKPAPSASVLSATIPLRKHVPLSLRGTPLAMGFHNGQLLTITKEQLVQFERRNPVLHSAVSKTISGHNGFTAATFTYSQFFKTHVAILATQQNKLSVFDLTELSEIYALDIDGGCKVSALISEKLSDTFWLGFQNGLVQCWTFGEAACKVKYSVPGQDLPPVSNLAFSRAHQLLFVLHRDHSSVQVYGLIDSISHGSLNFDLSQHDIEDVVVVDMAVVQTLGLLVLLGSHANVIGAYDLKALRQECTAQGMDGSPRLETAPSLQFFARYKNISEKIAITSLCVARLDDVECSEQEYSIKMVSTDETVLRKVILLFGLQNGSVLSALIYKQPKGTSGGDGGGAIAVDVQQFYRPKMAALMIGDSLDPKHKVEGYEEAGFVPPVLHIKKMNYSLQNDVLLASNQGCMVNILPGVRSAIERAELGVAPLLEQPKNLPLFSFEPQNPKKKKSSNKSISREEPKKKLKFISLGEKNDEKVKKLNWKGWVNSVKKIVGKGPNNEEKAAAPSNEEKEEPLEEEKVAPAAAPLSEEQQQEQESKVMEILERYSKQLNIHEAADKDEPRVEQEEAGQEGEGQEEQEEEGGVVAERAGSVETIELS